MKFLLGIAVMIAGFAGWFGKILSLLIWKLFIESGSQGKDMSETTGFLQQVIKFDEAVPWWGGVGMIFAGGFLILGSIFS